MPVLDSFLDAMGNTPVVRLRSVARGVKPSILAKLEMLNPGSSVKDRIGLRMIEAAEREGLLKPGGTIVEPTSGNTGHGLAIAAAVRGYRCIFVMPDKMSQEKISLLRAYGAEVVICPTAVAPESPESYYRVADRLAAEIPGAFQPNQYHNPVNPQTHYDTTGPEIWEQTEGRLTAFVCGVGTGGTISGAGRYLKERDPDVLVVGADPEGSIYSGDSPRPYLVEGIGEDFMPSTFDPSVVDRYVRVSDRDSFLTARAITRQEGILVGGSSGTAVFAALAVARELDDPEATIVVLLPDSGRQYMSKLYSETWMLQHGMLERPEVVRVEEVLSAKSREIPPLITVNAHDKVRQAVEILPGARHLASARRPGGVDRRLAVRGLDPRPRAAGAGVPRPRRAPVRCGRGDGGADPDGGVGRARRGRVRRARALPRRRRDESRAGARGPHAERPSGVPRSSAPGVVCARARAGDRRRRRQGARPRRARRAARAGRRCCRRSASSRSRDSIRELEPDVIAIDAPPAWAAEGRSRLTERILAERNIRTFATPTRARGKGNPFYDWMEVGLPGVPGRRSGRASRATRRANPAGTAMEVFPHASATVLARVPPAQGDRRRRRGGRASCVAQGVRTDRLTSMDLDRRRPLRADWAPRPAGQALRARAIRKRA